MRIPRPWTIALLAAVPLLLGAALVVATGDRPVSDTDPTPAPAGSPVMGAIAGTVTRPDGTPVADAGVLVASLDDPPVAVPEIGVRTGADGRYEWWLRPGPYEVTAVAGTVKAAGTATVVPGRSVTLDLTAG
ncbi:carboxypeptidase-like regulatory domain-containing protein [Phytohabitans sp. ZYX-F-186]|uniref:Carboxypeptidase-like regulatory domain-containing protein n=1 Tax=Phytohabitans maris TaxID=3071409 RepID=A0ABU0ZQY1_9ACTN|nr:carboxypeptidase-like regulatory domain-containing protein [Phytohabitans sp. ZYX-F-186]MDQ7909438.1 carboxypeptidase-like regulatory domain-containing protein [Phytohabitans sp. ZYX-F-186]